MSKGRRKGSGKGRGGSVSGARRRREPVANGRYAASRAAPAVSSEVLAKLAHELKTPLSAIAAAAEIMRDERLGRLANARYRGYAADICASARHALAVIDRLLQGAAPGGSRGRTPDLAALDVNALVESVVSQMRPLAERAGLRLAVSLAPRLPPLHADATGVRQILFNLLTNALKFTPAGGRVKVTTRREPRGAVEIEIRDTGPGMSEAELLRARAPADAARIARRKGGGLGIGLPLVAALASAMDALFVIGNGARRGTVARVVFARRASAQASRAPLRARSGRIS